MSEQIRGTTTNLSKLVAWDIDYYNSLSDEENCIVMLSEKELYLLRNPLYQMGWSTRWTSVQGTQQPNRELIAENLSFKLSGSECMDFCQLIIDCINDPDSGTLQAILDQLSKTNTGDGRGTGQNQKDIILGSGNNPACDSDVLFGGIVNVIERANENNLDALQALEVATNTGEWVAEVAGGLFGVEVPIVQSLAEWALYIQASVLENYEAQITNQYLEELQCDLFCLVKDSCELTPQVLVDYFFSRLQSQLTFESLINESLQFIFLGAWAGTELADVFFLSQFVFRAQLGVWFDFVAFTSVDLDMRLGMNDPDSDWTLLCTDCGWTEQWYNGNGNPVDDGFTMPFGLYESVPDRAVGTPNASNSDLIQLFYTVPVGKNSTIERISIDYSVLTQDPRTLRIRIYNPLDVIVDEVSTVVNGTADGQLELITETIVSDGWYFLIAVSCENDVPPFYARINQLTFNGLEDNIFE